MEDHINSQILDEMTELIYVADTETYELLYVNASAKEQFQLHDIKGVKCYKALQNKEYPCEFCTNARLSYDKMYTWDIYNPILKRNFQLKDKLINYYGRKARMEIAFDITERVRQKEELQNALDAEKLIMDCIKMLQVSRNLTKTLEETVAKIGTFLDADRAYIFEIQDGFMNNTYEWCKSGVTPEIEVLQNLDVVLIDRWKEAFDKSECVITEEIEEIKEMAPEEYRIMKMQNIHSYVIAPLKLENILLGYLGVDNPPVQKVKNISSLLTTLAYFITASMQRVENQKMLEIISYQDGLTEVQNRNAYIETIRELSAGCRENESAGVAFVDVNGLKEINDQAGHQAGDQALKSVVSIILSCFRKDDTFRTGGDEFVIISVGCNATKFQNRIFELVNKFKMSKSVSASIGYQWSESSKNIHQLITEADELMYEDKKQFYRGVALSKRYRHSIDDVLGLTKPGVLAEMMETGRFKVYYQPKVSLKGEKLIGAEALVRFEDQDGHILSPGSFIPVLEESRLINQLDFFVFEVLCCQLKKWINLSIPVVPVSVNFSQYSLLEIQFVEHLVEIWKKYDIPQGYIEIEITEGVDVDENYNFVGIIEAVHDAGFRISIDDFGIRTANLSLFTNIDFDVLKLDQSLTKNILKSQKTKDIVQAIIDICLKMELSLIAEGAETEEELNVLREMNCYAVQGFIFDCPLPAGVYRKKWLENG